LTVPKVRKGAYALFVTISEDVTVSVGALGTLTIKKGEYCYAGSAMNGLDQRIRRHFSKEKKMHWHIDRLTTIAETIEAFVSFDRDECVIAAMAEECGLLPVFEGFGASDCECGTHLFFVDERAKKQLLNICAMLPFDKE
jgi:Uri superfamily endonuclease